MDDRNSNTGGDRSATRRKPRLDNVNPSASSFVDAYGATVCLPAGDAFNYMAVLVEQLQAVTLLLTNAQLGAINLGGMRETFQVMANELASNVASLIEMVAREAGGAQ